MKSFKPLWEHILVQMADAQDKTLGGIIIPETAREKPRKAKVVAVGRGWLNKKTGEITPLAVKPGDNILIGSNLKIMEIALSGKKYEIIRENYIFAKI